MMTRLTVGEKILFRFIIRGVKSYLPVVGVCSGVSIMGGVEYVGMPGGTFPGSTKHHMVIFNISRYISV